MKEQRFEKVTEYKSKIDYKYLLLGFFLVIGSSINFIFIASLSLLPSWFELFICFFTVILIRVGCAFILNNLVFNEKVYWRLLKKEFKDDKKL